jgi:hypothetical protein
MIRAIDRLFHRLAATYGAEWDRSLGATPISDTKSVWAHELSGFSGNLQPIAWALENLPERCPNAIQFKNLCRQAPAPATEMLPSPKADPAIVKLITEKLASAPTHKVGRHDWAKCILQSPKGRSPAVVQMAKNALVQE